MARKRARLLAAVLVSRRVRGFVALARALLCEGVRAVGHAHRRLIMFGSQIQNDSNPFIIMCSVIAFHVVASALLLIDSIRP